MDQTIQKGHKKVTARFVLSDGESYVSAIIGEDVWLRMKADVHLHFPVGAYNFDMSKLDTIAWQVMTEFTVIKTNALQKIKTKSG